MSAQPPMADVAAQMLEVCKQLEHLSLVIESAVRRGDPSSTDEVATLLHVNRVVIAKAEGRA